MKSRDAIGKPGGHSRLPTHSLTRAEPKPAPGVPQEDGPYITCPFYFRETYILAERTCAACGEVCTHVCSACHNEIPASELSDWNICGYCDHMSSKR